MTENRENWLYSDASGLYFPHDGFIMRATDGKQYDIDEECELLNEYHKGYNECRDDVLRLEKENEQLKNKLKFFMELNKPYGDIIKENEQLKNENAKMKKELSLLAEFNQKAIL